MIGDRTCGANPAHPRTGVATFVVYTGLISGTLRVYCTFWLALYVRVAYVVSNTPTRRGASSLRAFRVDPAW